MGPGYDIHWDLAEFYNDEDVELSLRRLRDGSIFGTVTIWHLVNSEYVSLPDSTTR